MGKPVSHTMSQTGVRLSLLLSLLTIAEVLGNCEDFICRHEYPDGVSVTKTPVNLGDYCSYSSQEPGQKYYPPPRGVQCITKYNRGDDSGFCPTIRFDCPKFHLRNKDPVPWRCSKGDKMIIYAHDYDGEYVPTKKYCRNRGPRNVRSSNGLKINLKIERWTRGGQGAFCKMRCL